MKVLDHTFPAEARLFRFVTCAVRDRNVRGELLPKITRDFAFVYFLVHSQYPLRVCLVDVKQIAKFRAEMTLPVCHLLVSLLWLRSTKSDL